MGDLLDDYTLEFEKPVRNLERQIGELCELKEKPGVDISREIKALQKKVVALTKEIYGNLSPWERVQLSRHPQRPHCSNYIHHVFSDFHEVSGDRCFANDYAIITGFGYLDGLQVCVVGIEKGRKTRDKVKHNFGMPRPEGYRKALRVMKTADRFHIPIISLVDTPGAYPGIGAEERGQSCAIAENLAEMFDLATPMITLVIGEGGSGGALGIAVSDRIIMMEFSIYSVISPESCASILWADPKKAELAANALQLGPHKALELNVIDAVLPEPPGGAHRDPEMAYGMVQKFLVKELKFLAKIDPAKRLEMRFEKFRKMGNKTIRDMDDASSTET